MEHEQARIYFAEIQKSINESKELLQNGQVVDMTYCDKMVHKFCDILQSMSREEAQQYQNSLLVMDQELNAISSALIERRDELKEEIIKINSHSKAGNAYDEAGKRGS